MYRVDRNNFYDEQKNATIYTPHTVSEFLFRILHERIDRKGVIFDPCVGAGALLEPFAKAGFETAGVDIEDQGYPGTVVRNFLTIKQGELARPALVIANPPFNIDGKTKELIASCYGRRPLLPEVWLSKVIDLWGKAVPLALFTPYGLRLNQTVTSRRWRRFVDGSYPTISSIVALPKNVFEGILFHSEVLIFNVGGLEGHYFYSG